MGEPQQPETAIALRAAVPCARWTAKIHQPGLLRMQAQAILRESLRQYRQYPPCIDFPLEDQRRVIRTADLKRSPLQSALGLVLKPQVEDFVQVEITEQRRNYAPYNRAYLNLLL